MARPKKNLEDMVFDGWDKLNAMVIWADETYCAEELNISVDSLARRIKEKFNCNFAEYKSKKRSKMKVNLFAKQYEIAMEGNVTLLIWLGKQYLGQSDSPDSEDNKTSEINVNITKYVPPTD